MPQDVGAVTLAACTETPEGIIAHHSASGTGSLLTMNMPIRAFHPQLSAVFMGGLLLLLAVGHCGSKLGLSLGVDRANDDLAVLNRDIGP